MSQYSAPTIHDLKPRIVVFGVGGAGGNAVNNMMDARLQGVEFVVANTDAQALTRARTPNRIQLGHAITEGLGAGARPEVGQAAAQESQPEIIEFLEGAHMVFVAAGMGGGTGTGAAPVIARTARERGILTIAVVTKPFHFEGQRRMQLAEAGVQELRKHVDTLIVIPNQNLFRVANERTTFAEAFQLADQVLYSGVRGVTDLMVMPGLINLDFADVRTVMAEMGTAMMGTGEAQGPNRALDAAHGAMANPLLDIVSMRGAKGVLINITGGFDMTLYEVDQAANEIRAEVDPNANIILGSTFDETLEGRIRVSVVATGIDDEAIITQNTVVEPARRAAETTPRRPVVPPRADIAREPPPRPIREPAYDEPRPSFANDIEPERRAPTPPAKSGGGFSMFGWKKPDHRDDEPREFNLDAPDPEPETRRPHEDAARDPSLDEELEIPAFLRRQMNPR
jgi:cell division protein FtsZ